MPDTPARVGGRYELGPVLGTGGMADVRRAHDPVLGRDVAVKLLRTTDAVDRSRFASEARLLALLTHPNVVTVLDAGVEDQGLAWLALELVDGDTLADRFARGPIDATSLAVIGAQVAAALAHAHGHGVVHRDVKPSNVLIDGAGRARLTDFGIARLLDDTAALTMTGHTIGTAAYLAPEQVTGEPVTTASDVYALGLMLLEGLTGRREYAGPPVEAALARLHRSPLVPVSLPVGWPGLIATMTARQPDERPTADAVVERLEALGRVGAGPAVTPPPDEPVTTILPLAVPGTALGTAPGGAPGGVPAGEPDGEPDQRRHPRWALVGVAAAMALVVALSALLLDGSPGSNPASAEAGAPASPTTSGSPTPRATRTPTTTPTPTPAPVVRTPAPRPASTRTPRTTPQAGTTRPRSGPAKGGHKAGKKGKGRSGSKGKGKGH
ncbi:serine/threonine-protein kinase [Nocardioides rubriscoriae]|uniref:serine/threonine-protein kinase n=1 Tax=Nocardioides rubriscoriae TaxID=642762 RepID=UPI0011DF2E5A|nr:serine/threonine-protein kinase [Nocardioides rubriscoriae]